MAVQQGGEVAEQVWVGGAKQLLGLLKGLLPGLQLGVELFNTVEERGEGLVLETLTSEPETTLETSEDENYTRNEWRWKTTLETSEYENYTRNEWIDLKNCFPSSPPERSPELTWGALDGITGLARTKVHSKRVKYPSPGTPWAGLSGDTFRPR
jgi:hypothetical protein